MNEGLNSQVYLHDRGKLRIRIDSDPRLLLILLAFCEKNIVRYFALVVSMLPVVGVMSSFIVPAAYIILLLMYFRKYGAHVSISEACVVLFVTLAITFSCFIYPENARYILDSNNFWNTIFPCLRYFIIGLILIPDKRTLDIIGKASCLAIFVETLFVIAYMMPRGLMQSDDMSRAYQILPNVLFALNYAFNEKRVAPWVFSGIGIVYCLSMGTRGPIAVLLVYVFIRLLQSSTLKKAGKVLLGIVVAGAGYFFLNSNLYLPTLRFLRSQLLRFGVSTRVIDLAISGTVTSHLSGRDVLYELVLNKIKERPLLGYGVYGEWPWIGWSAHNMMLELLAHYGVILGTLLLLWLIILTVKSYNKTRNYTAREIILIWACFVFIRGIFGGSYLNFGVFFMIGFCLRELRRLNYHYYDKEDIRYGVTSI
jgi:O-antigen ligase